MKTASNVNSFQSAVDKVEVTEEECDVVKGL